MITRPWKSIFDFFNSTFFRVSSIFAQVMISNNYFNNLFFNYRIQIWEGKFLSDIFSDFQKKNMNLKKHFKRRLSSSKRNSLLNPELTSTENVPNCPIQPLGQFDHETSSDNTDQPTNSPIVDLTSNTDSNNVETVIH